MIESLLVYGFGIGMSFGIMNGIASAYKKGHLLMAIMLVLLGGVISGLAISPGSLTSNFDLDPTFLITSVPTSIASDAITERIFKKRMEDT